MAYLFEIMFSNYPNFSKKCFDKMEDKEIERAFVAKPEEMRMMNDFNRNIFLFAAFSVVKD